MTNHRLKGAWLVGVALFALPTAVAAQDNVAGVQTANTTVTTTTTETNPPVAEPMTTTPSDMNVLATDPVAGTPVTDDDVISESNTFNTAEPEYSEVRRDDNDFPWGLLGLIGLAGLLGRKKRDAAGIHVDARRDTRP